MKGKKNFLGRFFAVAMAAVVIPGTLAACGSRSGKEPETSSEAVQEEAASSLLVDADIQYINVPGENAEIAQEMKLSVDDVRIEGTVSENDIALKDSFAGMEVAALSNDENAVNLTISGTPAFDPEKINTGNYGTVEIAGKYFGEENPVSRKIRVIQLGEETSVEGGYCYPFFDSVVEKEGTTELTITLYARSADFAEDFSEDKIILENDFEDAAIKSLKKEKKKKDTYKMVIDVPSDPNDEGNGRCIGKITLKENSLIDRNGKSNAEPISVSRSYSNESLGKTITMADLNTTSAIVGAMKSVADTDEVTFIGTLSTASSIASASYMALGWFGLYPSAAQLHAEIMAALSEINHKVNILNAKMDEMNTVIQKQTDMLYEIEKDQKETALDSFGRCMTKMTAAIDDIEYALSEKNVQKINALLDTYGKVKFRDEKDLSKKLQEVAAAIGAMRASGADRISDKVRIVEDNFRDVISSLSTSGSNPINRYIQLCGLVDNFSTTSLLEKKMYALQIEVNITKAIGILNFFKGFSANATNRRLYDGAYLPDVEKKITKNGMPFCYLLNSYVKLSMSDGFWTNIGEDQNLSHAKYKKMSKEDGLRFIERMHGRTLWDELVKAGYPESMLTQKTGIGKRTGGYEPDQTAEGIGFIWISSKKFRKLNNDMLDNCVFTDVQIDMLYIYNYRPEQIRNTPAMHTAVRFNRNYSRLKNAVARAGDSFPKVKPADGRLIGAYGLMYNENSYTDFPIAQAFIHRVDESKQKETDHWRYEVCYPFLFFEGV